MLLLYATPPPLRIHDDKMVKTLDKCSAIAEMGDCLSIIDMGRKLGAVLFLWGAESKCNTVWPGLRPTFVPSGIVIHSAVWTQ